MKTLTEKLKISSKNFIETEYSKEEQQAINDAIFDWLEKEDEYKGKKSSIRLNALYDFNTIEELINHFTGGFDEIVKNIVKDAKSSANLKNFKVPDLILYLDKHDDELKKLATYRILPW